MVDGGGGGIYVCVCECARMRVFVCVIVCNTSKLSCHDKSNKLTTSLRQNFFLVFKKSFLLGYSAE